MSEPRMIPMSECLQGHVYRIWARNFNVGVYDGDGGFIGLRTKFKNRFLFTEYHWERGNDFGTVKPYEDVGMMPDWIDISDSSKELFNWLDQFRIEP